MSRSNLHRKIKAASKISANQYIRQFRLQKGLDLLQQTSYTVSEVSYKVGFSSPSYFIKCFGDFYGYSPGGVGNRDETETDAEIVKSNKKRFVVVVSSVVLVMLIAVVLFVVLKPFSFQQKELGKSIAVLPFRNDSPDSTNSYINGLMESIVNNLSTIEELDVRSRTSVEKFRGSNKSLTDIAKELRVNYIIEGSGQKIGNEILLSIQLLEAKTDRHMLSKEYRKEIMKVKDFFDLRNDVATNVVAEIKTKITPEEEEQIKKIPTENLEAYQFYLWGLEYLRLSHSTQALMNMEESHKNTLKAKYQFERAIAMDSTFVDPYVRLGNIYINTLAFTINIELSDAYLDSGLFMAEKAILHEQDKSGKITSNMVWAYGLKGTYYLKKGNPEKAKGYYEMFDEWVLKNKEEYQKHHNWTVKFSYLEDYYEVIKNGLKYLKLKPDEEITAVYIIGNLVTSFTYTGHAQ
jgi:TolB-like protein